MPKSFDLIVIGAGMAAVSAAHKCADAGWSVAIVDELPYGGTCALRGCDPKKILRRGAEIVDAARRLQGKGIDGSSTAIVWSDLVAFKRSFTDKMPSKVEGGLENNGVETLHGTARFTGRNALAIGEEHYEARHILIATGARPMPLDVPGAEHLLDNAQFMELEELPSSLLFIGGGFISFEFAHIAARAGAKPVIIDLADRPLTGFDADLVDMLAERSRAAGIEIHLSTELKSIDKSDGGYTVTAIQDGEEKQFAADLVVHGAGRVPALDDLNLEAADVKRSKKGVTVTEHLQSPTNPAVYAAGDAADTPGAPLTPVAVFEGKVAASNMLKGNTTVPDYRGVPSVVFTIPELARVGMLEEEAKEQGRDVSVRFTETGEWFSNMRVGESCAAVKVLIDNNTDEVLGAHLLGPGYAELVNFFGLAMKLGLKSADLKKMTAAYPTVASDLGSML